MDIIVDNHKSISDIQKEFSETYPFLKLEFFTHRHGFQEGSLGKDLLKEETLQKRFQKAKYQGKVLVIQEEMKVADLEAQFQQVFDISAQVFRKSGRSWIETTVTDDWTLKHQNDEGRELSYMAG